MSPKSRVRLVGEDAERFVSNVKILCDLNRVTLTYLRRVGELVGCEIERIFSDPCVDHVERFADIFEELPEDLVEEDLSCAVVNTLRKDKFADRWRDVVDA